MVLSMERWKGKVAIVTGASAGIGTEISKHLINAGVQVVELTQETKQIPVESTNDKLYSIRADMTDEDDIINAFKWTTKNVGPIHILINNAGVAQKSSLMDAETSNWRNILDTNVLGLSIATREAIRIMRKNNINGHIVHVNSITGHSVIPVPLNMYAASKHAVTALTDTLRHEFNAIGSKIKITIINPGYIDLENVGNNLDCGLREIYSECPLLTVEDVADAVMYALSTPPHVQVHEVTVKPINEPV